MKKQKRILNILIFSREVVCVLAGLHAIERIVLKKNLDLPAVYIGTLAVMVIMYMMVLLHVFIHEVGYMIFGLLTGYRFSSIRFLNFMLIKGKDGTIRLKKYKISGTAGQCLMLPPEMDNGTYPYLLYNMGGCILNLLTGIAAIVLYNITYGGIVSIIWLIAGIVGVFTCLINGIPIKQTSNAGYNTLVLSNSKAALKIFWIHLNIIERQSRGIAMTDMPGEWFKYLEDICEFDNLINVSGYVTAIGYYIEKRDFEKVKEMCIYANENAKEILPVHEGIVKSENLFVHLVTDMDKDKIEELTGKECMALYKLLEGQISMCRVWYAYYKLYKADSQKAQKYLDMVNKVEKTYPFSADFAMEKQLLAYVDDIACNNTVAE